MRILGIDQATSCGFALVQDGSVLGAGTWDLSIRTRPTKTIAADNPAKRLAKLRDKLGTMLDVHHPNLVAYEMVTGGKKVGGAAGNLSRHLEAVIMLTCYQFNIPVICYAAGTIKKHATGDGSWKTEKEHMIAAACKRWPTFMRKYDGTEDGIDDMVDAMWIADLAGTDHAPNWR